MFKCFLKFLSISLLIFLLLPLTVFSQPQSATEETITITTYYPAPYGSYAELSTTGNTYLATEGGRVGIGTMTPGAKLEVNGRVKITGGSPGMGKVLTSDNDGLADWQEGGKVSLSYLGSCTTAETCSCGKGEKIMLLMGLSSYLSRCAVRNQNSSSVYGEETSPSVEDGTCTFACFK